MTIVHALESLNPRQREAVEHIRGPLLVLAGAGSGKTRVLTHRIAYLIDVVGVDPWRILAITFTNKAAQEMKERLGQLVGMAAEDVWVSTFHAACVRILRREIKQMGYRSNFVIYDSGDQRALIKQCLQELNIDDKKFPPPTIAGTISRAKNNLKSPDQFAREAGNYYENTVASVYRLYQDRLLENNALDFDDLIMVTVNMFKESPETLSYYQDKFQYILVDEYQDTNYAQYVLVNLLAAKHRNLCVVGDPDQAIYGWRGATVQNILDFEDDYPETTEIKLEQNYRSTKTILEAANAVVCQNLGRKEKKLWTENEAGQKVSVFQGEDERHEARYVVEEIYRLHRQEKIPFGSMAILYRTNAQSRAFEEVLTKLGIPYDVFGGAKFYERKEIKDILAYLRVLSNPSDAISLQRIINVPRRGIGQKTWLKVAEYAAEQGVSVYQALQKAREISDLGSRLIKPINEFVSLMEGFRQKMDKLSVTELVEAVLAETGYLDELKAEKTPEAEARLENLQEFLSVTLDYDRTSQEKTLDGFLAQVSLVSDVDTYENQDDRVALMTLHTAKGLEFPVIFLAGLEEGVFPHSRSLLDQKELEEERRLCYVGMTRAMQKLYLTHAWSRTLYGNTVNNPVSRFLQEIPEELLERVNGEKGHQESDAPRKNETLFQLGEKVYHQKWGTGVIVQLKGEGQDLQISVAFPDKGIKHLLAAYAPLQKV